MVLEHDPGYTLQRSFARAHSAFAARDTAHFVRLVKCNHPFKIIPSPCQYLAQPGFFKAL